MAMEKYAEEIFNFLNSLSINYEYTINCRGLKVRGFQGVVALADASVVTSGEEVGAGVEEGWGVGLGSVDGAGVLEGSGVLDGAGVA